MADEKPPETAGSTSEPAPATNPTEPATAPEPPRADPTKTEAPPASEASAPAMDAVAPDSTTDAEQSEIQELLKQATFEDPSISAGADASAGVAGSPPDTQG